MNFVYLIIKFFVRFKKKKNNKTI
uniref:Uncharacterized protein n=1 Tax=Wuchereria bancrofti TaxID=6293 RepID=A0AAF5PMV7_WUCBA